MPDVEIDPLERAFATFRGEASREIMAPGSATAHRTVTRRRLTRVFVAAAVAFGVVGAGVFVLPSILGPAGTRMSPGSAAMDESVLMSYGEQAMASIVGTDSTDEAPPDAVFGGYGPITGEHGGPMSTFGQTDDLYTSTSGYQFTFMCIGGGTIDVTWSGAATTGSAKVTCGAAAIPRFAPVKAVGGTINIALAPDNDAIGRSGFAYVLGQPSLSASDLQALETQAQQLVSPSANPAYGPEGATGYLWPAHPGAHVTVDGAAGNHYVVEFVCVGTGMVTVHMEIGTQATDDSVPCDRLVMPIAIDASSRGPLTIDVTPDFHALGHVGWAFALPKG